MISPAMFFNHELKSLPMKQASDPIRKRLVIHNSCTIISCEAGLRPNQKAVSHPPLRPWPRPVWQVGNTGHGVCCCVRSLMGFLSRGSLPNTCQHPEGRPRGRQTFASTDGSLFPPASVPNLLRCSQVTWRLWAQLGGKESGCVPRLHSRTTPSGPGSAF